METDIALSENFRHLRSEIKFSIYFSLHKSYINHGVCFGYCLQWFCHFGIRYDKCSQHSCQ